MKFVADITNRIGEIFWTKFKDATEISNLVKIHKKGQKINLKKTNFAKYENTIMIFDLTSFMHHSNRTSLNQQEFAIF